MRPPFQPRILKAVNGRDRGHHVIFTTILEPSTNFVGVHLVIEYDRFRLKVASAKLSSITSKHFLPDHTDSRACLRTPTTSPAVVSMPDYQYNLRVCSRQVSSRKASACDTDEY